MTVLPRVPTRSHRRESNDPAFGQNPEQSLRKSRLTAFATTHLTFMNANTSTPITESAAPVVFIVDDDEAVREALTLMVNMHGGWAAYPCASAHEFLQSYTGQRPACLLLDLAMQEMNGAELLEALKSASKHLPTIVVTAHENHPMTQRAMLAGAFAVVAKPFRNEELTALIESVLPEAI